MSRSRSCAATASTSRAAKVRSGIGATPFGGTFASGSGAAGVRDGAFALRVPIADRNRSTRLPIGGIVVCATNDLDETRRHDMAEWDRDAFENALIEDMRAHDGQATQGPLAGHPLLVLTTTG